MLSNSLSASKVLMDIGLANMEDPCFWFGSYEAQLEGQTTNIGCPQIPGMIITLYVTQTPVPKEWKIEIARYLANYQRKGGPDDQGWGLYVALFSISRI